MRISGLVRRGLRVRLGSRGRRHLALDDLERAAFEGDVPVVAPWLWRLGLDGDAGEAGVVDRGSDLRRRAFPLSAGDQLFEAGEVERRFGEGARVNVSELVPDIGAHVLD